MLNQTSYHGAGAIAEIVNEAKAHDYKKAFVCSDPDLIKFQVSTKVTDLLDQAGLSYEIYSNITGIEKSTAIEFDSTEAHLSCRLPFQLAMQRFLSLFDVVT